MYKRLLPVAICLVLLLVPIVYSEEQKPVIRPEIKGLYSEKPLTRQGIYMQLVKQRNTDIKSLIRLKFVEWGPFYGMTFLINWKIIKSSYPDQFYVGGALVDDLSWRWDKPELTCVINHEGGHVKDGADCRDNPNGTARKIWGISPVLFVAWTELNCFKSELLDTLVSFNYHHTAQTVPFIILKYSEVYYLVGREGNSNFYLVRPRLEDCYRGLPGYIKYLFSLPWKP